MTAPESDDAVPYPDNVGPTHSQRRTTWRNMSLQQLRWVAAVAALALTAAFGGLRTADHATSLSLGQSYDEGPLRITAHMISVTDSVPGLPEPSLGCALVVLDATVENVASGGVDFGTNRIGGSTISCLDTSEHPYSRVNPVSLHGINNDYIAAVRVRDEQPMVGIEPGFTDDYRFVWVVKASDLTGHDTAVIHLPQLERNISTFRIAEYWGADSARYAELTLPLERP